MPTYPLPNDACPRCRRTNLRTGKLVGRGESDGVVFRPEDMKFWSFSFSGGVRVETGARACLDCGFIWTEVNPHSLSHFIATKCEPGA